MARVLVRHRWRYYCSIREKVLETSYWCEEEMIKAEHPDAVEVPGTRQELELSDDLWGCSTSAFLRNGNSAPRPVSQAHEGDGMMESDDMCGRYALYGPISRLREKMLLEECPEFGERYNIAPASDVLVIRFKPGVGRVGQLVKWGLVPHWADDLSIGNKLTNARGETVAEKPSFMTSFARHRCLIPASGFYEWMTVDRQKRPYYIYPTAADDYFAFAGLLAAKKLSDGQTLVTTCIITTEANTVLAPIHDRMPVIIQPDDFDDWLAPEGDQFELLKGMIKPALSNGMAAHAVSTAINRGNTDGPWCITPIETFE